MVSEHGVHSIDKLEMNFPCAIVWRRFQWVSYAFNETISIVRRFCLMTILPRKGLLAIAVVVDVALQTNGRPIPAKTLATRNGLPPRHLESVLQSLVRDGILKGIRGPHGGYELARERRGVTASDILRAAGTVQEAEEELTSELVAQVVLPVLSVAEEEFGQALSRISLDDMVHRAAFHSNGRGRHKSEVEPHVDLSR
jgi:Rrf2 family transcriptional regulator, iron-sulfur cluster assembly transcription factor